MSRKLMVLVLVIVLAFSATAVFAGEDDPDDARLNPPGQTLWAIYYHHEDVMQLNEDDEEFMGDLVTGIEIWWADPENFVGHQAFYVDIDLAALMESEAEVVVIADEDGYYITYAPSTAMFSATLPDGYSLSWLGWWEWEPEE